MVCSESLYYQVPLVDSESRHSSSSRVLKVSVALVSISCFAFLCFVAVFGSNTTVQSSNADESTSLFGVPTSVRMSMKASPMRPTTPQMMVNRLPGASPWKEIAMAGMEASSRCGRDVSMNANLVNVVRSSMGSGEWDWWMNETAAASAKMTDLKAGQTSPMGFFDPLALSAKLPAGKILFYREAELKHGRVCMLASLGFLVGEVFHPLWGGNIDVPSYIAFQATPLQTFWPAVAIALALPEFILSVPTFNSPAVATWQTKTGRVPGDLGYDPLGLKPKDPRGFLEMQNKELNNGRLAMIGIAGMVAQELVNGQKIFG